MTITTPEQNVTHALLAEMQDAARTLDKASELAEQIGWPSMARDLAVAMVTVQRCRSEFHRMIEDGE